MADAIEAPVEAAEGGEQVASDSWLIPDHAPVEPTLQGLDEPEEEKPAEAPAEPPADATAGTPKKEGEEPDKAPAKPAWDPDRQRRDQERALQRQNQDLKAQLDAMQAKLDALGTRAPADEEPPPPDEFESLDKLSPETAELEDLVNGIKVLRKKLADATAELAEVKSFKDSTTQERQAAAEKAEQEAATRTVLDAVAALDKQYGVQFKAEALKLAEQEATAAGYGPDNPPDGKFAILALKHGYREASLAKPAKPAGKEKPQTPPVDTGGGGAEAPAGKRGTLAEVKADMEKAGRWR